jgi:methionyl-tRNA formyltransferase
MKIVMFARTPVWYGFSKDRLALYLKKEGYELAGIVVETTSTVSSLREWVKKLGLAVVIQKAVRRLVGRKNGFDVAGGSSQSGATKDRCTSKVFHVKSHNSAECEQIVKALGPDVLLLRGCGILKEHILNIAAIGVINPHYAALPAYRGVDVTEWSLLHGDPCAVSIHWVSKEVDGGAVIVSQEIDISAAPSLGELRERCAAVSATLFAKALSMISAGEVSPTFEEGTSGRQYFNMHPRIYALAERRLSLVK